MSEPWRPPETEQQKAQRESARGRDLLRQQQAELEAMSVDEVLEWFVAGQAEAEMWAPFELEWYQAERRRKAAPWN